MNRIIHIVITCVIFLNLTESKAQYVNQVYSVWDDALTEWTFETEHLEFGAWVIKDGTLRLRYMNRDDWTEWTYEHDDLFLTLKLKWKDNPDYWEMTTPDGIITAKTVWRNDHSVWRIQGNQNKFTLESRYKNNFNEWELRNNVFGNWHMMTDREGDPRNWLITDEMEAEIDTPFKVMFSFLVLISSTK